MRSRTHVDRTCSLERTTSARVAGVRGFLPGWGFRVDSAAFTLIELLIVITIIAILAAMLFPVFSRARSQARKVACSSNERQLAMALNSYATDWDEVFPPAEGRIPGGMFSTPYEGQLPIYWWDRVYPYVRDKRVYLCPEEHPFGMPGYAMNFYCNIAFLGSIRDPSDTFLVLDQRVPRDPVERLGAATGMAYGLVAYRHFDGALFAFVDGHVKRLTQGEATGAHWKR